MDVDEEPTEAEQAEWAKIVSAVAPTSPAAQQLVDETVDAFGDAISVVLLARFGDWFRSSARAPESASDVLRAVQSISTLFEAGDDRTQTIVATGFLEAMPYAHEEDRPVVELLPTPLRQELHRMETASPPR